MNKRLDYVNFSYDKLIVYPTCRKSESAAMKLLPSILDMLELCMSGHALSIFLRSSLAQTMKAFIGRLMCGLLSLSRFCWRTIFATEQIQTTIKPLTIRYPVITVNCVLRECGGPIYKSLVWCWMVTVHLLFKIKFINYLNIWMRKWNYQHSRINS